MNTRELLNQYLRQLERRLRTSTLLTGAAIVVLSALLSTLALVWIMNRFAFSAASLTGARLALFVVLSLAAGFAIAQPLLRLNRRRAAARAERIFPEFEQRLITFAHQPPEANPFVDLLAQDTLDVARHAEAARVVPPARLAGAALAMLAALGVLLWLILAAPGYMGHGASLLWAGTPKGGIQAFYDIKVSPGDATVRRKSDQLVTAQLVGLSADKVTLYARYHSTSKWEQVPMQPQPAGPAFEFLFAGLPESVEYYVEAGAVRSPRFNLNAVDLPAVKRIKVTYRFPSWSGLGQLVEEQGGDLRAVEGTEAYLEVETDKPLPNGVLVTDAGTRKTLEVNGTTARGSLQIEKDGLYHLAMVDNGQLVRLSEDYFIEARKENAPTIRISRPGRDYKASPVEEVTVSVNADDDYGLQEVTLHYSVNGGAEKTLPLLKQRGAKQVSEQTLIALEDFQLVPGDIVSLYATARDARSTTRTDMFFIEAQPFEREYSQAQTGGGGGGAGGEEQDGKISQRQKEIISATFNQQRDSHSKSAADRAEAGRFLSDVQAKLRDQANSLARRMQSRELSMQNQEFAQFAKDMTAAAAAMSAAADKLKAQQWQDALPHEQKALQHLLRAESIFRKIQVAFGQRGGGGGGGAARDLENLFDLELDTEKNQYETGQQTSRPDDRQKQVDEALARLEQLARRQQELAEQQRQNQQTSQQRWQQEMLRREAEQLERQMEQLSRSQQQGQGSSAQAQPGQQSQQAQQGQQGQQGQQSRQQARSSQGVDPRLQRALEQLRQATEDMRRAASNPTQGQASSAEARRAAERLQEARDTLNGMRRQQAGDRMAEIVQRAENLANQQQDLTQRIRKAYGNQSPVQGGTQDRKLNEQLAAERQRQLEELQRLEKQMQDAARDLAGSERAASSKLREALGNLQQNELGLRMKYSAEWMRRGLGQYAAIREGTINNSLERLREQVKEAQERMGGGGQGKPDQDKPGVESALNRLEQMQRRMEMLSRGQQAQQGQQAGQQGQQGQQAAQLGQPGQQPGQQGQAGQQGQQGQGGQQGQAGNQTPGGRDGQRGQGNTQGGMREARQGGNRGDADYSAMNSGGYRPELGRAPDPSTIRAIEQAFRENMQSLSEMRQDLADSPEAAREVQQLIRDMQRLNPNRFPGNPELVQKMLGEMRAGLEQLELQLRRKLDEKSGGQVRSASPASVPNGYQESVAEYFRRLSRSK